MEFLCSFPVCRIGSQVMSGDLLQLFEVHMGRSNAPML